MGALFVRGLSSQAEIQHISVIYRIYGNFVFFDLISTKRFQLLHGPLDFFVLNQEEISY
jgi:hypothetical protein